MLIVQSDGKILLKYVASNPDDVTVTADGIFTFLKDKNLGGKWNEGLYILYFFYMVGNKKVMIESI